MRARLFWSQEEDARLAVLYPDTPTLAIATELGRSLASTYHRAFHLGLAKSAAYLASPAACRLRRGDNVGAAYRFPTGHAPANKGLHRPGFAPGRMKETQFQKGKAPVNWRPVGSERVIDGYRYTKVSDERGVPWTVNWKPTHILTWEAAHGPLVPGHAVAFKNGDKSDIRLDNLECITRAELMMRNTVHNLPAPLPEMVQLIGALNRKINRRNRKSEEQDRGSEKPSVRCTGRAGGSGETDGDRAREGDCGRGARDRGQCESGSGVPQRDGETRRDRVHPAESGRTGSASTRRGERSHALVAVRVAAAGGAA